MTSYSGSIHLELNGTVDGQGWFLGQFDGSFAISDAVLAAGGVVDGVLAGSGTLRLTAHSEESGTETWEEAVSFAPMPFSTTLAAMTLPLDEALPEFGLTWSQSGSFDALRTSFSLGGTGSFDAMVDGHHVAGSASLSAAFAASSVAYSIAPLAAAGPEGTGLGGAFTFAVTRHGPTAWASSVAWAVAGAGAAPVDGADFAGGFLPSGIVEFAPGETVKTLSVTVGGDSSFEPDEQFTVTVANAPGEVIAVAPSAGGTVLNDDTTAIISIAALEADRAEGEAGATGFTFLLSRAGGTSGSADVGWLVEGHGVRPADGADFAGGALPSGSVSFAPGEMEKVLTVQVAGDTLREGNEGFVVSLVAQSGAELGTATAVGTIRADEPLDDIIAVDVGTGLALASVPSFYSGPVPGLERELLAIVPQNVVAIASGPNWFIHTGSGDDAIRVQGGRNVLDGGTGSNFLTGADGEDTFFLDARDQTVPIWSTLVDFGVGDSATVWGLTQASAALMWEEGAGAGGFTGLTLHAWRPGVDFASLTFAGFTRADLDSGRLGLVSGRDAASGSDFLLITGLPQS